MINKKLQEQIEQEFKTDFKRQIEAEEKEQEQILNNYTGGKDYKLNPIF